MVRIHNRSVIGAVTQSNSPPQHLVSLVSLDNGRVYFTCMGLFTASFSVTGPEATDTWYIIDMEFLLGVGGSAQEHVLGGAWLENITILR